MNAPPRITLAPPSRHDVGSALDLIFAFDAARAGHHDDFAAADFHVANLHHSAGGTETAAGQLVRRNDAVDFLDAIHQFDNGSIEVFVAAHASEHGVDHAGGAVNVEPVFDQAGDDFLDLRLGGALLHYD